jgi:hypothetical protein
MKTLGIEMESLIEIHVSFIIWKLAHAFTFFICSKLFAIGKSIMLLVLHEFVPTMNVVIPWLEGAQTCAIMEDFRQF